MINNYILSIGNFFESDNHALERNPSEIISLAAGNNSSRYSVGLSGRKYENSVRRGFFQCLKKCIKSTAGEHVNLVNDVYLVFGPGWKKHDLVANPSNIINTVIGCGVHFNYIHQSAVKNTAADLASITGIPVMRRQAVDCSGENFGNGCLSGAAGSAK